MIYLVIGICVIILVCPLDTLADTLDVFLTGGGLKCPVCGRTGCWTQRYWGANKDYDDEFCSHCYRALRHIETGEFTTYSEPQDWK